MSEPLPSLPKAAAPRATPTREPADAAFLLDLGTRLGRSREEAGLTLSEAGRRARLSKGRLLRIERGEEMPGMASIRRLANTYGLSIGWLLVGQGRPTRSRRAGEVPPEAVSARAVALRVVAAKSARGLSGRALGEAAGLSTGTVSSVEDGGSTTLSSNVVWRLAVALSVPAGWLAAGEGPAPPGIAAPTEMPPRPAVLVPSSETSSSA